VVAAQPAGAARLFDEELDRALLRLAVHPGLGTRSQWPRLPDVRRLLVRRVEYVVFYRLRPRARRIEVLGCGTHVEEVGPAVKVPPADALVSLPHG
jgi:plasmid stabilization system protein ParE